MQICFPGLRLRRVLPAACTWPFQVNRNDERITIASPSFILNAHRSRVISVGRHGGMCPRLFYHACAEFIQPHMRHGMSRPRILFASREAQH